VELTEVLRRGILTEESVKQQERNKYTFEVALDANKIQIRQAVETLFKVKVASVNTMRMPGKVKMFRRRRSAPRRQEPHEWKKAIVTLKEGYTIDILKA
jgi:large subunit ribosomal protein L23